MTHTEGEMIPMVDSSTSWNRCIVGSIFPLLFLVLLIFMPPIVQAQHEHEGHAGMSMPMDTPPTPAQQAKFLSDKRESEFNHHLAGFFVVLGGLFILVESGLSTRFPVVRYVWPACFLLSGLFVLVF